MGGVAELGVPLAEWRSTQLAPGECALWWLGQSGFVVRSTSTSFLIDPYLSDSLARKYAGTKFPHSRMMPAPATAASFGDVDLVLCTHRHSDHMDGESLRIIAACGRARFLVPMAHREYAINLIATDPLRVLAIDARETLSLNGLSVTGVPAAHERLEMDALGHDLALGYVIGNGAARIYHAGDCIPYPGLIGELQARLPIDIAILPVNGRDAERTKAGVLGNFTIDEELELCSAVPFPQMIASHFGMFDFNTVHPDRIRERIGRAVMTDVVVVPQIGVGYTWRARTCGPGG